MNHQKSILFAIIAIIAGQCWPQLLHQAPLWFFGVCSTTLCIWGVEATMQNTKEDGSPIGTWLQFSGFAAFVSGLCATWAWGMLIASAAMAN